MPWLTPDDAVGSDAACWHLAIPAQYSHVVYSALVQLGQLYNWEEHGDDTEAQAVAKMQAMLDNLEVGCMPAGMVVASATDGVPDGWLACDGSQYDRVDWPVLYAALDAVYVVDPDTFEVPDLRGRVITGEGQLSGGEDYTLGDNGGEEYHQLTTSEMPSHQHTIHTHSVGLDVEAAGVPDLSSSPPLPSEQTAATGGDTEHENRPPYAVLNWIIKAV